MTIQSCNFKGLESVVLENNLLRIVVLPKLGGKIASFFHKTANFELAFQNPSSSYSLPPTGSPFERFDCSGFDDAFPCIDSTVEEIGGESIIYPDHGELWCAAFDYRIEGNRLHLSYTSPLLNYLYEKTLTLSENTLHCHYHIHNFSSTAFPYIWTCHALVKTTLDMEIIYPYDTQEIENVLDCPHLGKPGQLHPFPTTKLKDHLYDFRQFNTFTVPSYEKFYIRTPLTQGHCGIHYPSSSLTYYLDWDPKQLPYLGFWITKGRFKGDYNCALEPSTGYYDSISKARSNRGLSYLEPNQNFQFDLAFSLLTENR